MEVARDPSDKNLKLWFQYIETKNKLASRLQNRMKSYLMKNSGQKLTPSIKKAQKIRQRAITKIDPKRFRIRMYFESTCPHCKKMMGTLKVLQENGFYIEAHQIDSSSNKKAAFPVATTQANPQDLKKHKIDSVPFTIIADLKSKTVSSPIKGYQSVWQMRQAINLMQSKTNKGGEI